MGAYGALVGASGALVGVSVAPVGASGAHVGASGATATPFTNPMLLCYVRFRLLAEPCPRMLVYLTTSKEYLGLSTFEWAHSKCFGIVWVQTGGQKQSPKGLPRELHSIIYARAG